MNVTEDDLKEAFEKLPPRMQAVLALRAAGYTQHEVGTVVQISRMERRDRRICPTKASSD